MKKFIYTLIILIMPLSAWSQTKVAMLISGHGNQGDINLSYDLEELAQSYLVLVNNDILVDIVSPEGGSVNVHNKKDNLLYIQDFKKLALDSLKQTISAKEALKNGYDAVMIIGGDGAMFDLPFHHDTQVLLKQFVDKNKPIAAVCHGPAALVDIKLEDGSYFVSNRRVNSFTRIEDNAFKKDKLSKYPFVVQTKLEARGAIFESNSPMLPYVAVDDKLITAQNPMSVAKATEALILALNKSLKPRELFKDEATLQLVSMARAEGDYIIDIALAREKQKYDMQYLAMYGFYAYQLAETKEDKLTELRIMEQVSKHFSHPNYSLALIQAYLDQDFILKAKALKQLLLRHSPDFKLPENIQKL